MRSFPILAAVLLLSGAAATTSAGDFRLAPFVTYSTGLSLENLDTGFTSTLDPGSGYGLAAGFNIGPERWIEVLWSHQDLETCAECLPYGAEAFDLKIDSLHLGGMWQPGTKRVRPYAAASAGVTLYNPSTSGQSTTAGFSFALGGGADFMLSDRVSLRLDGRGLMTFGAGTIYGACGGGCTIGFSVDGNIQFQAFAALVVWFP